MDATKNEWNTYLNTFRYIEPFVSWSWGWLVWVFGTDPAFVFVLQLLSQLTRFNWLVDFEFRLLNTFDHWNDNNREDRWVDASIASPVVWFEQSISMESVDLDVRNKFVWNELFDGDDVVVVVVVVESNNLFGVDDGVDIGFGQTQRNFNLSHVGQSNLLNCNWIFC